MGLPVKKEDDEIFDEVDFGNDMGRPDSLRFAILNFALSEQYDNAIDKLRGFLAGDSEYPNFKQRAERYVNHAIDLIYAIKAKRSFPGIGSLTRAKQQELNEKFKDHLKELKEIMKKIEHIEDDLRIADARSTIYVIKSLWWALVALITAGFIFEFFGGIAPTAYIVIDDMSNKLVAWLFSLF